MARRKKANLVTDDQRPPAPSDMEPDAVVLWDLIVESEAPGFFKTTATQVLLRSFVNHTMEADRLHAALKARKIDKKTPITVLREVEALGRMYAAQTAAAADKATKLRITNQARYTPQGAGRAMRDAGEGSKPWEDDES
jgi:hypothetical protein